MKMKSRFAMASLMALLISGCDNSELRDSFYKIESNAMKASDPFKVMNEYYATDKNYQDECKYSTFPDKDCYKLDDINKSIMMNALDKGSTDALLYLFTNREEPKWIGLSDLPKDVQIQQAERLIKLASSADANKQNSKLFIAAGNELQSGDRVMQSTSEAIDMYIKAWKVGDMEAAEKLASLYKDLGNVNSMYFWQIRALQVESYSDAYRNLDAQTKLSIQKKAADRSIINL